MALVSMPAAHFDDASDVLADPVSRPANGAAPRHVDPLPGPRVGRGVLDGAFAVLGALSDAHRGLGLTDLAHASGLAKTSAYRLAEQLVAVGAVQRVAQRYYVGPLIGHLGRCWQPDPLLRRVCEEPIRRLSALSGATAAVYVLHLGHVRLISATAPAGQSWIPPGELDAETTPHTAVGRVLLAAHSSTTCPVGIPQEKWELWRAGVRGERFVITDSDRAPEGCCCAAAPIWGVDGRCVGAVLVLARAPVLPGGIVELLLHTSRHIRRSF